MSKLVLSALLAAVVMCAVSPSFASPVKAPNAVVERVTGR